MYRCQKCGEVVPKGVSRQLIVIKKPYQFQHRRGVNKKIVYEKGRKSVKWFDDKGGWGEQIVAEIPVCLKCMIQHQKEQEKAQEWNQKITSI